MEALVRVLPSGFPSHRPAAPAGEAVGESITSRLPKMSPTDQPEGPGMTAATVL